MLEHLLFFDINYFSVILLVIMYVILKMKKEIMTFSSSLFSWIIFTTIIGLLIETMTWIFDGRQGVFNYVIAYSSNFILILSAPVLVGLWASYLDYKLIGNKKRIQKWHYYQWPTYITFLLLIINFFHPIFFEINDNNEYIRGNLHVLRFIVTYVLFLKLIQLVVKFRNKDHASTIIGILAFMILPAIGAVIQAIFPYILSTWSFLTLGVVIIYIFLETTSSNKDYLTQIYSRKIVEDYLNSLIEYQKKFIVIMIDLDRFKLINDHFGHSMGDQVLIRFSRSLSLYHEKKVFASRLGGDEFLVVLENVEESDAKAYIHYLRQMIDGDDFYKQFNQFSFSAGFVKHQGDYGMDDLLNIADHNMYHEKSIDK